MSIIVDYNISEFLADGKLLLQNQKIENCRIIGMQFKTVRIINCVLKNVVFQNHIRDVLSIDKSVFVGCKFCGTICDDSLDESVLGIRDSEFTDCLFENISFHGIIQQSSIFKCKFGNSEFKNIKIVGGVTLDSLVFNGGSIEKISYIGPQIMDCRFLDMQMQDIDFKAAAYSNEMENIILRNVILTGDNKRNNFINCDTSGFTFIKDDRW